MLVAPAGFASDLLILVGGERRSGALTSCDDERCIFNRSPVPLSDLAWLGLGVGEAEPPRGIASPGAVLSNGTQAPGRIVGISLGRVVLDTVELERSAVRWLRVAAAPPEGPPPVDVLVRRDGAIRIGALQGCTANGCTLAGETTTRAELAWIGLAVSPETVVAPAAPQDPMRDLAQFADGTDRVTPLVGVSASNVVLGIGTFPRADVAWIYVAPPAAGSGPPVIRPPSPPGAPPSDPAPGAPPPVPAPGPPPAGGPSPAAPPAPAGEPGALWSGSIQGIYRHTDSQFSFLHSYSVHLRLREVHFPHLVGGSKAYDRIRLRGESLSFAESFTSQENFAGGSHCDGSGEASSGGLEAEGERIVKSADADLTPWLGFDLPRGAELYRLTPNPPADSNYTVHCRDANGSWTSKNPFSSPTIGRWPTNPGPAQAGTDPEIRYLVGGRMRGSFEASTVAGDFHAVSWSLCRQGDACPPAPELPEGPAQEFDPCGRSGQQAALRDTCHAQLDAKLEALTPALAEYNDEMAQAEANRAEFERAQEFCKLYDKAKEILEAILSGGTGPAAEAAEALVYLRGVLEKAQSGDLGSMLYPSQVAKFLGYYNKAKSIWFEVTASEIEKMQRNLGRCSGKVPIETYLAAQKFLEHFSAAKQIWDSRVAPGVNDLRSTGIQCAEFDHAAWRACLDDAECHNVPPDCGPEPSLEGAYD